MPERDIESLGLMGKGGWRRPGNSSVAAAVAAVVVALRKWVLGNYRFPPFSDTYERSRRATAGKLLAVSLRFFFVFKKNRDFSKTILNTLQKISAVSEKSVFLIAILKLIGNSSS